MMIEALMAEANADKDLARRGRYVSLDFLVGIGDEDYIVGIEKGRVARVARRQYGSETGHFSMRADQEIWRRFWTALPPRGDHDLLSMLAAGTLHIDGDILPLIQNLQYFKDLLAALRPDTGS